MSRQTKGRIYKRGRRWYLDYQANGTRFRVALRTPEGEPVTNKEEAERAADTELLPLRAKDTTERRRQVAAALRTAEDEAAEAERIANERREREEAERNKLPIAEAWKRFPYTRASRGKGRTRRELKPATVNDLASHWATFAAWAAEKGIGAVEDIEARHVAAFSKHLRERVTANRHNKILATCSVVCRQSGRPDPFAAAERYSISREAVHRENLEPGEIRNIIEAAPGEYRRLFIVGTYTGLRLGDCATLQWADIRMEENGGRIIRETAKTGKAVRFPIHSELRAELERTPPEDRAGAVCPELAKLYTYRNPNGKTTRRGGITNTIRDIFEGCGLETRAEAGEGRERAASVRGFHSFRHSFVTECARAGVPLGLVKDWLGHSSPEVTRIYENWNIDRDAGRILEALPSLALPEGPERPAAIEGNGTAPAVEIETERDQLARLARELPAARVRDLLAIVAAWAKD